MVGAPVRPTGPQTPQKQRPTAPQRELGSSKRNGRPGLVLRIAISLLIVWHFAGIFLAAMLVPATSPLVLALSEKPPMQWYLDVLYLNQQHSFFAPEVGPGHIIRYELLDQSGRAIGQGEWPNRKEQWPRLFYHRYMMLADQADFPADNKEVRNLWQRKYLEAYGRHLLELNKNAQSVRLQRIAHWPLPRDLALQGKKMTDPQGYDVLMDITVRRSDLGPAPSNQSLYWQDSRMNVANRRMGVPR